MLKKFEVECIRLLPRCHVLQRATALINPPMLGHWQLSKSNFNKPQNYAIITP
jgi:hypothetical protein